MLGKHFISRFRDLDDLKAQREILGPRSQESMTIRASATCTPSGNDGGKAWGDGGVPGHNDGLGRKEDGPARSLEGKKMSSRRGAGRCPEESQDRGGGESGGVLRGQKRRQVRQQLTESSGLQPPATPTPCPLHGWSFRSLDGSGEGWKPHSQREPEAGLEKERRSPWLK